MLTKNDLRQNRTAGAILLNMLLAAVSLFVNGFGVYLTIQANIGAGPWDVLNLGLSKTLGILYGTASIAVSLTILVIDILLREPISLLTGIPVLLAGLVIVGYTQYTYMIAALGCGPRDTLLVGLAKRARRVPIGAVSIALLSLVILSGWLLGGPVGVGTLLNAFCAGPIMQFAFHTVKFDAAGIRHQRLRESVKVFLRR